ncbi:MAG: hypothetical protein ABI834_00005 [Ginsengibacter sp.]
MENFYSAYSKTVNGDTFYFVKKYRVFPEYNNVPPILDKYAMHSDFEKACKIAMIYDKAIQQQLADKLPYNIALTSVKEIQPAKAEIYRFRALQINLPSLLKLNRLRKVS